MVIDTSALVAILCDEPERSRFTDAIARASIRQLSAATYAEAGIVLTARFGPAGFHRLMLFVVRAGIDVIPVDSRIAETAVTAYSAYGKGLHRAGLNYGDCFSYALARAAGDELLFKGTDFSETDVRCAKASERARSPGAG